MKKINFIISLLTTIALIILLNNNWLTSGSPIPAVGKLLNPFTGFWQNAEAANTPPVAPKISSDQLSASAKVVYDDRLVPHIFAENTEDAFFLQGYVVAKHRLWQMDFATRAAAGRLSEVLGERLLEFDKDKRAKGMVFAAENALETWKKFSETYPLIEKYVAGVNTYIESLSPADYPLEYKILGYAPEKWTALKTALFAKSMAETLASRAVDVSASNTLELLGREKFDFVFPTHFPEQSPIIPDEVQWDDIVKTTNRNSLQLGEAIPQTGWLPFENVPEHLGSNNWAVGKAKSATGNPILCGDPHLRITLPAIWYENQIHTPEFNAYGVSIPGLPGITIGFNEHIAWSMTNVGHDVSDFYTITWKDSTKQAYLMDGKYLPVEKRVETYQIQTNTGMKELKDTLRFTKWGPVYIQTEEDKDLALRWIVHDGADDNIVGVALGLNSSKNYDDYRKAIYHYNTPAQNVVFAAEDGDIGITVQGLFPHKAKEQGRFLLDGSLSQNAWQGTVPKEHNPAVKNPALGYVASANQHSTNESYPYPYHSEGFEAYRGRYLNQQLEAKEQFSVEDMKNLQNDPYSLRAAEALPLLLAQVKDTQPKGRAAELLKDLQDWDFKYEREQTAPIWFEIWFSDFYKNTWDELLKQQEYDKVLSPKPWRTVFLLRDSTQSEFFDIQATDEKETAKEVAFLSFQNMVHQADSLLNKNPELDWANYQQTSINHLGRIPAFSRKNIYTSGTRKALNAISRHHGPSWRMVVELGNETEAHVVYPGGQSGNPGSRFYDDFIDKWAEGDYYEALFLKNAEEEKEKIWYVQEFGK